MSAVGFLARVQLRRRWRALVVVAVLAGLIVGLAAALAAGARRSATVVNRYFERAIPYSAVVYAPAVSRAEIAAMPGVRRVDLSSYVGMTSVDARGRTGEGINGFSIDPAAIDPTFKVLRGRKPTNGETLAALVNENFVDQFRRDVGADVRVRMYAARDFDAASAGDLTPHGPDFTFHIVGVVRTPDDIALDVVRSPRASAYAAFGTMFVTDRFYVAKRASFLDFGRSYDVQLDSVAHRSVFVAALRAAATRDHQDAPPSVGPPRFSERHASFETPVGFETTTLVVLAAVVALGGALFVGLLLRAEERTHAADVGVLRALGCSSRDLRYAAAGRMLPFALLAVGLGIATMVFLSPSFPIGVGGELEPAHGVHVDLLVLGAAVLLTGLIVVAPALVVAGRDGHAVRVSTTDRPSLANRVARGGAPVEVVVGTHFAFERQRAPMRRTAAGGAVVLLLVLATGVFVAGIDRLYREPARHGWPWDAVVGDVNFELPASVQQQIAHDRRVTNVTLARFGDVTLNGKPAEVLAFDEAGTAPPRVLRGRLPRGPDEIALGTKVLDDLGSAIGGHVRLALANGEFDDGSTRARTLDVVGVALAPSLGESDLGKASMMTLGGITASGGTTQPELALAKLRGPDPSATARAFARDTTAQIATDTIPSRVVNLDRVRRLPLLGAGLAAFLGLVLLVYGLTVSATSRRHDLSVLRALGMSRRRLRRVLSWQGVALGIVIILIGVPIGLLGGALGWRAFADQLGVATDAHVPAWAVLAGPVAVVAAVLASVVPAHRVLRSSVSASLRVE